MNTTPQPTHLGTALNFSVTLTSFGKPLSSPCWVEWLSPHPHYHMVMLIKSAILYVVNFKQRVEGRKDGLMDGRRMDGWVGDWVDGWLE